MLRASGAGGAGIVASVGSDGSVDLSTADSPGFQNGNTDLQKMALSDIISFHVTGCYRLTGSLICQLVFICSFTDMSYAALYHVSLCTTVVDKGCDILGIKLI